jgi:hypothetical protein
MIDRLVPDGRFGFLKSEDGREFYFQEMALDGVAFDELSPGAVVEFSTDEASPSDAENPTAINVRVASSAPQLPETINTDRGGDLDHEPPESIQGNRVSEASWESFPASDPPARRQIT